MKLRTILTHTPWLLALQTLRVLGLELLLGRGRPRHAVRDESSTQQKDNMQDKMPERVGAVEVGRGLNKNDDQ